MFFDLIHVLDAGIARLRNRAGSVIAGREWGNDQPAIHVQGWVEMVMRERGKIVPGSRREGKNIFTNTGREYVALLMSLQPEAPFPTAMRTDSVAYLGVGTGSYIENEDVLSLATPVAYAGGEFLAALDIPPTFPLLPIRRVVRFKRTFAENEITVSLGQTVNISELGLYTDGDPAQNSAPRTRITTLAAAASQMPIAYKAVEPVAKNDQLELEISWELRI